MKCLRLFLITAAFSGVSYGFFPPPFGDRGERSRQSGTASSYISNPCVAGTPQFPNYLQPMKVDPKRVLGKWYSFLVWFTGIPANYTSSPNLLSIYTNLLNDSLTLYPGSNTPAVAYEQLGSYIDPRTNQCSNRSVGLLNYVTVDGQTRGLARQGDLPGGITYWETSLIMSTDYDSYILYYQCLTYGIPTGMCADPRIFVQTRDRPDQVSSNSISYIGSVVDQILGPYCFTVDLMKRVLWLADVAECPVLRPRDDCYSSVRNAYLYLGDPNFTG